MGDLQSLQDQRCAAPALQGFEGRELAGTTGKYIEIGGKVHLQTSGYRHLAFPLLHYFPYVPLPHGASGV